MMRKEFQKGVMGQWVLNFPWARKLSLARKTRDPIIRHRPALKMYGLRILYVTKKKNSPAIVSIISTEPQSDRMKGIMLGRAMYRIIRLMLQNEKVISTIHKPMNQPYLITSLMPTLFSAISLVIATKAYTSNTCPSRKNPAPASKTPKRRKMSPTEPRAIPQMMMQMLQLTALKDQSQAMRIQRGMGLVYLRKLLAWSESPILQRMEKRRKRASRIMQKRGLLKGGSLC